MGSSSTSSTSPISRTIRTTMRLWRRWPDVRRYVVCLFIVLALLAFLPTMPALVHAQQRIPRQIAVPAGTVRAVQADPYTPHIPRRAIAYQRARRALGLVG